MFSSKSDNNFAWKLHFKTYRTVSGNIIRNHTLNKHFGNLENSIGCIFDSQKVYGISTIYLRLGE